MFLKYRFWLQITTLSVIIRADWIIVEEHEGWNDLI